MFQGIQEASEYQWVQRAFHRVSGGFTDVPMDFKELQERSMVVQRCTKDIPESFMGFHARSSGYTSDIAKNPVTPYNTLIPHTPLKILWNFLESFLNTPESFGALLKTPENPCYAFKSLWYIPETISTGLWNLRKPLKNPFEISMTLKNENLAN